MARKIKYPVGIQTFSKIRENDYLYVDKTALIYNLANSSEYVFLSRPRRFGKSLLTSTLEAYFKGRRDLFEGLEISRLEKNWIEYPVFRFDLSPTNYDHPRRLISLIKRSLDKIGRVYGLESSYDNISDIFIDFIEKAYYKYGRKVVILIDEYDKPLLDCLHNHDLHSALRNELRGFYSAIKASDEYIRFAMLTGITKFGKVSIFSGLNNLRDISLLPEYNAICGITESEFMTDFTDSIRDFARAKGMSEQETWTAFKSRYDGYHFASEGEHIYNPFCVLSAFNDIRLDNYWYGSGSPDYLIQLIERNSYPLDKIEGERRTKNQLGNISDVDSDFIPLLFQSGYLTIKGYDEQTMEYTLGFPNREVYDAFWNDLKNHFFRIRGGGNAFDLRLCTRDILEGNADAFMTRLKALFADTSSEPERRKEIHFQNMVAIVAKMLGMNVRTEVHSSAGRCDMQILTDRFIYILEFKINGTPQEALRQIHEKGYLLPFAADTRGKILIGADFSSETRTFSGWIVEKLNFIVIFNEFA